MDFGFKDLDWRSLLIKRYKDYGLDENDVMVLLVTNEVKKTAENAPITSDTLAEYMYLDKDEIDTSLSKLLDRSIVSYETAGNAVALSLKLLHLKLYNDVKKDLVLASDKGTEKTVDEAYAYLEKTLNRTLTPLEIDKIANWVAEGCTSGMIQTAAVNVQASRQRLTFTRLEKEILRQEKEQDISKEGYTLRNETNRDERKLNDILSNDWLHVDK